MTVIDFPLGGVSSDFVPSVLESGDTLASLAILYGIKPEDITGANLVEGAINSCDWGRSIAQWVLHEGKFSNLGGPRGIRHPVVASEPNNCEPGKGFAAFVPGQVILLPKNGPRHPVQGIAIHKASALNLWGLALVAAGLMMKSTMITVAGVAVTARIGPFKAK